MALINWSSNLSVNIAEIDQQHKKLIDLINELNEAMKMGKGTNVSGKILNELVNYTLTHFKTEERYFAFYKYPDAEKHIQEHETFTIKVSDFVAGIEQNKLTFTLEMMRFLSEWLKKHIMGTDKQYSEFFNQKGLR